MIRKAVLFCNITAHDPETRTEMPVSSQNIIRGTITPLYVQSNNTPVGLVEVMATGQYILVPVNIF
jgi:hypothetical protein